jgi:PAS domain-containing protein
MSLRLSSCCPRLFSLSNYRKDGSRFRNNLSLHPLTDEDGQARFIIGLSSDADADVRDESDLQLMRKLVPTSCPNNPDVRPASPREGCLEAEMAAFTLVLCCESPAHWFGVAAKTPEVINAFFKANEALFKLPKDPRTILNDFQLLRHSVEMRGLEGKALQLRIESMWLGVKPPVSNRRNSTADPRATQSAIEQQSEPRGSVTDAPAANAPSVACSSDNGSRPTSAVSMTGTIALPGEQQGAGVQGAIPPVESTPKAAEVASYAADMAQALSGTSYDQRNKLVFERMQQAERAVAESLWLDHIKGEATMEDPTKGSLGCFAKALVPNPWADRRQIGDQLWSGYSSLTDEVSSFLTGLLHWANLSKGSVTVADMSLPGAPLIYVNESFVQLSGFLREEALGRNCRFLQGPETEPQMVASYVYTQGSKTTRPFSPSASSQPSEGSHC